MHFRCFVLVLIAARIPPPFDSWRDDGDSCVNKKKGILEDLSFSPIFRSLRTEQSLRSLGHSTQHSNRPTRSTAPFYITRGRTSPPINTLCCCTIPSLTSTQPPHTPNERLKLSFPFRFSPPP
uniref:Putative secreted protein n=1 Tax=Anopheles marajoara TaxID=58244 RepID=A0A2M4C722_9DIPT